MIRQWCIRTVFLLNCVMGIFFASTLQGDVQSHFKKATGKEDGQCHSIPNVDYIYIINLDQRPEKFEKCINQLHPYGIYPYRFSAVNGWELTLEDINDVGLKFAPGMEGGFWATKYPLDGDFSPVHQIIGDYDTAYFCHCMARGTIGIVLSHLSVLQDAYDSGYETIWVMEDDVEVVKDPRIISSLIEQLDHTRQTKHWDIFFTDQDIRDANGNYIPCYGYAKRPDFTPRNPNQYAVHRNVNHTFKVIGARFGAHSYIIRRSGMEKILNFIKEHKIFHPYDMDFYAPQGIKMFSVIDDIVTNQARALSDNGGPNYLNKAN